MGGLSNLFANPAMLAGIAAITAPILIFLLTRYRYQTIDWAALVFLQRAFKRQQRRLRLENLILLLIRCLILILFAIVLARPRALSDVPTKDDEATRSIVLLLDTSYSTGYQVGSTEEESVYARARRAAKDIVAGLKDGDRINIVAFDEDVRALYPKPRQLNQRVRREILQDLDDAPELARSERGTSLSEAFHELPRILRPFDFDPSGRPPPEGAKPVPKTIYLLTDAQRLGFLDQNGNLVDPSLGTKTKEIKKLGGVVALVDCGLEDPKNVSVTHLGTREPVVGQELPCHIEAIVKNWSVHDIKDLTVEYFVDGANSPQKTVSLTIPAGEEATPDPLRYKFHKPGLHRVEVRVRSDGLTLDNRRHFVIDVRESVRVLLVDGEPFRERWRSETDFVRVVLSLSRYTGGNRGLMRPDVINESQLSARSLDDYEVVLVANVESLSDESTAALERYVRSGGAVIFTMGGLVKAEHYNETLWRNGLGLFPCKLLKVRGGTREEASTDEDAPEWVMKLGDHEGHAVALFSPKEMRTHLRLPSIYGFYAVDLKVPSGAKKIQKPWVPLRLIPRPTDDSLGGKRDEGAPSVGQPVLVEKEFGRGRVVAWLSSVDYAWNNCVLYDGFYLPFWRQLVLDLAQRTRPALNLKIGGRYRRVLPAEEYAASIEVETPVEGRIEGVALTRIEGQELYELVYPTDDERGGLQESGLYTLRRKGSAKADKKPAPDFFAVQIHTEEGNLAKFGAEELQEALSLHVKPVRPEGARDSLQAEGVHSGSREYWREFLVLVLILLVLESVLAALFGRKRK